MSSQANSSKSITLPQGIILGGELSNSAATSVADIDEVMPRMRAAGLNTVLIPAYWELMEPSEGQFDFTLIDRIIDQARAQQMNVILLWFGAWKNSMSCYAPSWFKENTKRFPRAETRTGKPLEIATAFSNEVLQADMRAFLALIRHLKETDDSQRTVTMVQIENEIGMLEDARDHSPLAEKAYRQDVPTPLLKALGLKQKGTWSEIFGTDLYADEQFQAWHYACYVQQLAAAAHQEYDIPFFVNAAMNSRGRKPGEYPSAGPLAHLAKIWKCAAPDVALLSPDIYDTGFKGWAAQYAMPDNRLFIPETRSCMNTGVRALYTFGEYKALGFSPFAIDQASAEEVSQVTQAYNLLRQLSSIDFRKPSLPTWGLLFDKEDQERTITDGNLVLTCRHFFTLPWDARATDGSEWREGGGIIVRLNPNEYIVAGSGIVVEFHTATEQQQLTAQQLGEDGFAEAGSGDAGNAQKKQWKGKRVGLTFVNQISISEDGTLNYIRRDNGDQSHQGRHARISPDDYKILHIKLYEY
ncbi:MAG: DUF5597 domain-containing protein [Prevotella sp.]|nr:DUF5597 domain-containing protein [Prevotella sp.]